MTLPFSCNPASAGSNSLIREICLSDDQPPRQLRSKVIQTSSPGLTCCSGFAMGRRGIALQRSHSGMMGSGERSGRRSEHSNALKPLDWESLGGLNCLQLRGRTYRPSIAAEKRATQTSPIILEWHPDLLLHLHIE